MNFNEPPTYHEMDPKVVAPKRLPNPGETVLIRTIGTPQVKLIVDRMKEVPEAPRGVNILSGQICGKAIFFEPTEDATPWTYKDIE